MAQTAYGISFLHQMGFAHNDIKPDNIFIEQNTIRKNNKNINIYLARILDLGFAKPINQNNKNLTYDSVQENSEQYSYFNSKMYSPNSLKGVANYTAPEKVLRPSEIKKSIKRKNNP